MLVDKCIESIKQEKAEPTFTYNEIKEREGLYEPIGHDAKVYILVTGDEIAGYTALYIQEIDAGYIIEPLDIPEWVDQKFVLSDRKLVLNVV